MRRKLPKKILMHIVKILVRSLRNTRTRIHKNLFVAMVVQVLIRLILYIDIELLRNKTYGTQRGIGNTVSR